MVAAQYWQFKWASEAPSSGKHKSMLRRQPNLPVGENPSLLAVRSFRDRRAGSPCTLLCAKSVAVFKSADNRYLVFCEMEKKQEE